MKRFQPGRYVMYRRDVGGQRMYFTGRFEEDLITGDTFPRETPDVRKAYPFLSAAHGYKYGSERAQLQAWRVGRV